MTLTAIPEHRYLQLHAAIGNVLHARVEKIGKLIRDLGETGGLALSRMEVPTSVNYSRSVEFHC